MPNAPRPPSTLSFSVPSWSVLLQKDDVTPISLANGVSYMRPLEVHFGVGTHGLPRATFQYDLAKQDERIVDQQTPTGFSRQIRIIQYLTTAGALRVFNGDIAEQDLRIGNGERAMVVAQLSPFHFGNPLYGPRVVDKSGTKVDQNTAVVFNPKIDNVVCGNMNKKVSLTGSGGETYYPWVSPESCRTTEAINAAGNVDNQLWTLDQIVCTLCWICNPNETYVKNPTLAELTGAIGGSDIPDVKNISLHRGHYLPQILDELLRAFGCAWTLAPRTLFGDAGQSYTIKVFQLGNGTKKDVLLQRPGSSLTRSATNVRDLGLSTSISEMFNVITAHGALKEYEFTAELYRGWPESEDSLSADDLDSTGDGANKDNKRAWRWWVLNEGGDFTGTRTTVAPISSTFSFATIFDTTPVPRRRKFLKCISYSDDTLDKHDKRRKPYLQWLDTSDTSGGVGGTWKEVPTEWGPWQVHEHMCAIQFTGDTPPEDLIALGPNARLRITASVADDVRITSTASRQDSSPNGRDIVLFLDVSDRFFYRKIISSGTYTSIFNGQLQEDGSPNNDARDDTSLITTFATNAQKIEDAAVMRADITIAGINVTFKVGDLIRSVNGRNISFNRKSAKASDKSYPQVFGITYDWRNQATILDVRPLEEKPTTEATPVARAGAQNIVAGNPAVGAAVSPGYSQGF